MTSERTLNHEDFFVHAANLDEETIHESIRELDEQRRNHHKQMRRIEVTIEIYKHIYYLNYGTHYQSK